MSKRRMDAKTTGAKAASSREGSSITSEKRVQDPEESTSSAFGHLAWVALAVLLGAASYFVMTRTSGSTKVVEPTDWLPESYAVCTEPGKVYTVDEGKPNVDCVLVVRGEIASTGSRGELHVFVFVMSADPLRLLL